MPSMAASHRLADSAGKQRRAPRLPKTMVRYCFGFSRLTAFAGLSSLSPLNDGWRTLPSRVQAVNSTSATSCGWAHRASLASGLGTATNGEESAAMRWSFAMIDRPSWMLQPVPTDPAQTSVPAWARFSSGVSLF